MGDIIKLINYSDNGAMWNLEQMLEHALDEIRTGKVKGKKGMLIILDDYPEGSFGSTTHAVNLRLSERIALMRMLSAKYELELGGFVFE